VSFVRVIMYGPVVHLVEPSGCTPRGGGAGRRSGGQGGRGESPWNMVNLTMSSFYGIMELRDFRITKRESSLANN